MILSYCTAKGVGIGPFLAASSGFCNYRLSQAIPSGFGLKRSDARWYSPPVRRTILCLCLLSNVAFAAEPGRVAGLSTTTPVTQDLDHATYDW